MINKSGSITESFVRLDSNTPHMSEIVIWDCHWVQVMKTCVHVQTGLDVICWHSLLLEIFSCLALGIGNGLVFLRKPASLSRCFLFLVSFLLDVFTEHRGYGLDSLLVSHLSKIPSKLLIFGEL